MADVKIVMTEHGRGDVFVDGRKVDGVRAVEFSGAVDRRNEVRLTLLTKTVSIEGPAELAQKKVPLWRRILMHPLFGEGLPGPPPPRRRGSNPRPPCQGYQPRPAPPPNPPPKKP